MKHWSCLYLIVITVSTMVIGTLDAQDSKGTTKSEGKEAAANLPSSTPAPAPGPAAIQTMQGLGAFGQLLPLGERNLDVKIPSFRDGLPSSMVRAGSMTKIDDQNMEIEKMDIRLYGVTKDRDVRVQMVTANYNMPSQVLSSDERSRISRQDFQLEGDEMIFDTNTQQGKIVGKVEMVIFDTAGMMSPAPPTPTDAGESTDAKDPQAPAPKSDKTTTPSSPNDKK